MTILAGAFSLDADIPVSAEICNALRQTISRVEGEVITEIADKGLFLAKVDICAFGVPALHQDALRCVTMIAGEPLIKDGEENPRWNRAEDVALLHPLLSAENWEGLERCRGTFCGVHYNAVKRTLALFTDKTGVRPLYLWIGPHFAVFSTALRILETIKEIPKHFDLRGVTEIAAFGYPLGDRTAYLGIRTLHAGEVVRIANGQTSSHTYWRWDNGEQAINPNIDAVQKSYMEFMAAINRRQNGAPVAAAFLSGGLDSRAIVGGLRATGSRVYTVNFAPDGTQDQVFADLVASTLKTHHTQLVTNAENVTQGYRKKAVSAWMAETFSNMDAAQRPTLVWSGDGGSVALGHVYLNRCIVDAMARGATDEAVTIFNKGISTRIIKPRLRKTLAEMPTRGAQEELAAIKCADRGRAFHLFLMLNDQRRHLMRHFEDIDVERIEFQLPFFDADFLETILRSPVEPFLEHRFYMDWLEIFPNRLAAVPWQAYPGHVPCTIPSPPGLRYQWEQYYNQKMLRKMTLTSTEQGKQILASQSFPAELLSRGTLRVAIWLTRLGLRDYSHLIRTASVYHRYWVTCYASKADEKISLTAQLA